MTLNQGMYDVKHAPRPSSFCVSLKHIPESRHCVLAVLCKLMPCFANALINANARRIGYVALGSIKLIRDACLLISTFFTFPLLCSLFACLPFR